MSVSIEIAGKRILFFTKVILTFLTISILLFLNYLDLNENKRNQQKLSLLKEIINKRKVDQSQFSFEKNESARLTWLKNKDSIIEKIHSKARKKLISGLQQYGEEKINAGMKGEGFGNQNRFILMTNDFSQYNLLFDRNTQVQNQIKLSGNEDIDVDSALIIFNHFAAYDSGKLLTDIDTTILNKLLDSYLRICRKELEGLIPKKQTDTLSTLKNNNISTTDESFRALAIPAIYQNPISTTDESFNVHAIRDISEIQLLLLNPKKSDFFSRYQRFTGLFLHNDTVYINISNCIYNANKSISTGNQGYSTGNQGSSGAEYIFKTLHLSYTLKIPAKSTSMLFPSILETMGYDKNELDELSDKKMQKKLSDLYGYINLKDIDNIISKSFERNNDAVSILGFDVSRKWFPIAMFFVLIIIYTMLFQTINAGKIAKSNIVSGFTSEDAVDFLIDKKWIRLFLWAVTPLLLLFFSLFSTLIHYDYFIYCFMVISVIYCFVLGLLSYKISL